MSKQVDRTGQRYGRLVVKCRAESSATGRLRWNCVCDCGADRVVHGTHLANGHTTSCGCARSEATAERNVAAAKHGMWKSPEFGVWSKMLRRCHSPQDSRYKDYGARGIFVCEEWRQDFKAFYDHIGPRPGDEYSVERIRNNEGYKPGNVKWATPIEQNNNKRTNVTAVIGGEVMTAAQIARAYGLTWRMVQYRIERGMDEAQIIAPSTWRRNAQT